MKPISIYGAGSWGTALAVHLAEKGTPIRLWDRDLRHLARLRDDRENRKHLPGILLPDLVEVVYEDGVPPPAGTEVVLVPPSQGLRWLFGELAAHGPRTWVIATKGLEEGSCLTMREVVEQVGGPRVGSTVVLAGPSLAREVSEHKPTAVLAASEDKDAAKRIQELFSNDRFRVYTSPDPLGVELGTSLKNVIALAAGMADGLGLGQNARGALLTRGLAEIRRLGEALGAEPETFLGLAGVGDLVTTCTSTLSRNHTLGEALGRGERFEDAMERIGMVVEGVSTVKAACELARRVDAGIPIADAVRRILFEGLDPRTALHELMTRPLRAELG